MSDHLTLADLVNADHLLRRARYPTRDTTTADAPTLPYLTPNVAPAPETQPCSICAGQGRTIDFVASRPESGRKCYGCKGKGYLSVRVRTR